MLLYALFFMDDLDRRVPTDPEVTSKVFIDVKVEGDDVQRIEIGLFGKTVPKTAENFLHLCRCDNQTSDGKKLCYRGSKFHRIIPGFMIQGGDIKDVGSESIYGGEFDDENFDIKHASSGYVSMANSGENTNGSQFFITVNKASHLDGKHVVFGKVLKGMQTVKLIESYGNNDGIPSREVIIVDSGEL